MSRTVLARLAVTVTVLTAVAACGSDDDEGAGASVAATAATDATTAGTDHDDMDMDAEGTIPEMSLMPTTTVPVPEVQIPESVPTELVVTEITPGDGPAAVEGDLIFVHYVGVLSKDGTQFETNFDVQPTAVKLGAGTVIAGWDQGLVGATQGERLQLDIPSELAYGDQPKGDVIQAGDALTFLIDVLAIVPPVDPAGAPTSADLPLSSELATEAEVIDLREGDGATIEQGDSGIFHLIAMRADDGEVLESTWEADPIAVDLVESQLITEMFEGLSGMKVGGRRLVRLLSPEVGREPATDVFIVADLYAVY